MVLLCEFLLKIRRMWGILRYFGQLPPYTGVTHRCHILLQSIFWRVPPGLEPRCMTGKQHATFMDIQKE